VATPTHNWFTIASERTGFVTDGFGVDRRDVMYNDFVIVGIPVSLPMCNCGSMDQRDNDWQCQ
jgi:ABC-type tungstate transport system permease subunit